MADPWLTIPTKPNAPEGLLSQFGLNSGLVRTCDLEALGNPQSRDKSGPDRFGAQLPEEATAPHELPSSWNRATKPSNVRVATPSARKRVGGNRSEQ